jgi:hypothetical protein
MIGVLTVGLILMPLVVVGIRGTRGAITLGIALGVGILGTTLVAGTVVLALAGTHGRAGM